MTDAVSIDTSDLNRNLYKLAASLSASPATMRRALTQMIVRVEREAKTFARSGGAFSPRSRGRLAVSIGHKVSGSDIAVLTTGVKYGMIQEFGGQTPAHDIKLRFAKAFAFASGGGGFSNAAKIGNSKKFAQIGSSRLGRASAAGRSITGMTIVSGSRGTPGVIKHPGSRIPPTHYARKSFEAVREEVQQLGAQIMREAVEGKR